MGMKSKINAKESIAKSRSLKKDSSSVKKHKNSQELKLRQSGAFKYFPHL